MTKIQRVSIVTAQGASTHTVGMGSVESITVDPIRINGDPFEHYCCYDKDNKLLVAINCTAPCEIIYFEEGGE